MSLAALIKAESTPARPKCKTCLILELLTEEDRDDFQRAAEMGVQGAILSRAITKRAAELGLDEKLGQASVRFHLQGHP